MNGADLLILVNTGTAEVPVYEAAGCERDATIEETSDTIDNSCKDSRAMRVDYGRYSSTISLDALYVLNDGYLALKQANRDGELILVAREEQDIVTETALAKIDSISETFPDQAESTISISMTIDGWWEEVGS